MARNNSENNNNGSGVRRRLLSINDQIDSIQDASFRNYTRNIEKRFQRLAEQQARMISQTYDQLSREEKARARDSLRDQTEQMKRSLENWKRYNSRVNDDLSSTEKFATKLFYWNRRKDLRNLEREARYRFKDIEEDAEELGESLSDTFGSVADSLREWSTALNVNSLVSGLEDTTQSTRELRVELQKNLKLTDEEWSEMKQNAREFSKETGYAISNIEYLSDVSDIIIKLGIDDKDLAQSMAKITTKFTNFTGVTLDDQAKMIETSQLDGMGGIDYQKLISSQMMALQQAEGLWTSGEDLMKVYNDNIDMFRDLSNGNRDLLDSYTNSSMALTAAGNAGYIDGLDEKLYDIMNMSLSDLASKMEGGEWYLQDVQNLMKSGDFEGAAKSYIEGFNNLRNQMISQAGMEGWKEYSANMDLEGLNESQLIEASNVRDFFDAYDQAMQVIDEQTNAQIKMIDEWTPDVTWGQKVANWWKSSWLGDKLDGLLDEFDVSLSEVFLGISAFADVAKLFKGSGLLSKIPGLGKLLGGAEGAAGGSSLLGKLGTGASAVGNFFRAGFGGAGANTAAGAAGMNILGFGAPGGMATLGTGGAMSAGALATGAMGLGGLAWMGVDAYKGTKKANEWLGRDDTSAKVISGVGGAIGGTGPGWADEGSIGDKAKNTLAGAGKGALIGGAIGSIIPGLGTAIGAAIGGGVGAIASAIGGEKISKAIDWVGEKASGIWAGVKDVAGKAWDGITGFASNAWDKVKSTASNVWDKAKGFGIDAFNTAVGVGDMAMEGLFNAMGLDWDGFKGKVSEGWNNIKEWGTQAWDSISSWASEKWEGIKTSVSEGWNSIKEWGSETWTNISDWAGEKWEGIKETATGVWDTVSDWASDKWDDITDVAGKAWDTISDKAGDVWDDVKEGASKAFDTVKDKASDIWGGIKDFFNGAKERGEEITGIDGSHKNGLDTVPKDGYIAELHKNEAVLTSAQADQLRAMSNGGSVSGFFHNIYKTAKLDRQALIQSYQNSLNSAGYNTSGSGGGASGFTAVTGSGAKAIWDFLRGKGLSKEATAGLMGNLHAESGLNPQNLQNSYESRLGSDSEYTAKVDSGSYSNFAGDSAGYGLAQWTYSARKKNLLSYAKSAGTSIGDLGMQLNFLWKELNDSYGSVISGLRSASSLRAASDIVLHQFEKPANQSASVEATRASYGQGYYNQYNAYEKGTPWVPNDQVALIHKGEMVVPADANPYNQSGNSGGSTNSDDGTINELIQVVKWGVSRIEKAIGDSSKQGGYNLVNATRARQGNTASDEVFSYT